MSLNLSTNDWEEFFRQCSAVELKCDANNPIRFGETIEPCLRGCDKIKQDKDLSEFLYNIYRGEEIN